MRPTSNAQPTRVWNETTDALGNQRHEGRGEENTGQGDVATAYRTSDAKYASSGTISLTHLVHVRRLFRSGGIERALVVLLLSNFKWSWAFWWHLFEVGASGQSGSWSIWRSGIGRGCVGRHSRILFSYAPSTPSGVQEVVSHLPVMSIICLFTQFPVSSDLNMGPTCGMLLITDAQPLLDQF